MGNKRILVVDDDLTTQNMLRTTLDSAGYAVLLASDGHEGVKLAREELPDLIILDVMMPGMHGGEVLEVLKGEPETKNIPVIFLSVLIPKSEEKISKNKEATSFLAKPFSREKLLHEVKKLTQTRKE
jgi:CheY-like chemotaxis protein